MSEIEIRRANADEAPAISALVLEVFELCVAPHTGAEGRVTFGHEAAPEAMAARLADSRTALVACAAGSRDLVGYIEVEKSHIRELFVAGPYQRCGIARDLLARAFQGREEADITVNAAPGSLDAYAGLGFKPAGPRGLHQRPHLPTHGAAVDPRVPAVRQANSWRDERGRLLRIRYLLKIDI